MIKEDLVGERIRVIGVTDDHLIIHIMTEGMIEIAQLQAVLIITALHLLPHVHLLQQRQHQPLKRISQEGPLELLSSGFLIAALKVQMMQGLLQK